MANAYHLLLVKQEDLIPVQSQLRDDLNDETLLFTRQLRELGTVGPTTHWLMSILLTDAQQAFLPSIKINYPGFDFVSYQVPPSRTQDPIPDVWLADRDLELI